MRVLHYVESFSELSQTFIYDLINELENQGVDNFIVTKNRLHIKERPFDRVTIVEEPSKWELPCIIDAAILLIKQGHYYDFRWRALRKKIFKEVQTINPDIIHSHFGPAGIIMAPVAKKLNIPHIISFHGFDAFKIIKDKFWLKKYELLKSNYQTIICVSDYMKHHLKTIFPKNNIQVVHVGKKLEDYQFELKNHKIKNWLSIGRITAKKGHFDTIKAFSEIIKLYPHQTLKIIGDGNDFDTLKNLIKSLKLDKNVFLLGALSHRQTKQELKKAEAFILASKTAKDGDREGIPTVLMEAQFIGLPCVSTLHSGIPEVFTKRQQFFLAEENNIDDLKNKIEALIALPIPKIHEMSKESRLYVEKNFNLEIETFKLISIYNSIFEQ